MENTWMDNLAASEHQQEFNMQQTPQSANEVMYFGTPSRLAPDSVMMPVAWIDTMVDILRRRMISVTHLEGEPSYTDITRNILALIRLTNYAALTDSISKLGTIMYAMDKVTSAAPFMNISKNVPEATLLIDAANKILNPLTLRHTIPGLPNTVATLIMSTFMGGKESVLTETALDPTTSKYADIISLYNELLVDAEAKAAELKRAMTNFQVAMTAAKTDAERAVAHASFKASTASVGKFVVEYIPKLMTVDIALYLFSSTAVWELTLTDSSETSQFARMGIRKQMAQTFTTLVLAIEHLPTLVEIAFVKHSFAMIEKWATVIPREYMRNPELNSFYSKFDIFGVDKMLSSMMSEFTTPVNTVRGIQPRIMPLEVWVSVSWMTGMVRLSSMTVNAVPMSFSDLDVLSEDPAVRPYLVGYPLSTGVPSLTLGELIALRERLDTEEIAKIAYLSNHADFHYEDKVGLVMRIFGPILNLNLSYNRAVLPGLFTGSKVEFSSSGLQYNLATPAATPQLRDFMVNKGRGILTKIVLHDALWKARPVTGLDQVRGARFLEAANIMKGKWKTFVFENTPQSHIDEGNVFNILDVLRGGEFVKGIRDLMLSILNVPKHMLAYHLYSNVFLKQFATSIASFAVLYRKVPNSTRYELVEGYGHPDGTSYTQISSWCHPILIAIPGADDLYLAIRTFPVRLDIHSQHRYNVQHGWHATQFAPVTVDTTNQAEMDKYKEEYGYYHPSEFMNMIIKQLADKAVTNEATYRSGYTSGKYLWDKTPDVKNSYIDAWLTTIEMPRAKTTSYDISQAKALPKDIKMSYAKFKLYPTQLIESPFAGFPAELGTAYIPTSVSDIGATYVVDRLVLNSSYSMTIQVDDFGKTPGLMARAEWNGKTPPFGVKYTTFIAAAGTNKASIFGLMAKQGDDLQKAANDFEARMRTSDKRAADLSHDNSAFDDTKKYAKAGISASSNVEGDNASKGKPSSMPKTENRATDEEQLKDDKGKKLTQDEAELATEE